MSEAFPPDIQQFVRQELASGNYRSEEELVVEAVRFFRDNNLRLKRLRQGLKTRLERLGHGDGVELESDEALGAFFDRIDDEVDRELATSKNKGE